MGFINGTLKYVEFTADVDLKRRDPGVIKKPKLKIYEEFIDEMRDKAPIGLKSLFQNSPEGWLFLPSEKAFVDGAI